MRQRVARARSRSDVDWLLHTTNRMVRCRSIAALLDLAYDAIRDGLGYDRVGLLLVDRAHHTLVEHIGTDEHGCKFYPPNRVVPLDGDRYYARVLSDPRMGAEGPGFIYMADASREMPPEALPHLDGPSSQLLHVSLRTADAVLGIIGVDNLTSGRPLTPADAPPLVAFANALAVAVENITLLEERARRIDDLDADLRRRVAELEWLREMGRRVNAARSLDEMLDVVYDGIRDGLGYRRVGIQMFDHATGFWRELRGTDEQGRKMRPTDRVFALTQGAPIWGFPGVAALLNGAELYYTSDAIGTTPPALHYMLDGDSRHFLAVPLRSGDAVTGTISVDSLAGEHPINPDEAGPLLALANQVGTAVENAWLHERERAERARLQVLLDSARALNSTLDRDQILHELAARLVIALDAAGSSFTRVDLVTRRTYALAYHSAPGRPPLFASPANGSWPLDDYPVMEQTVQTGTPFYGHVDDPTFPASEGAFLRAHNLQAELIVPVVVRGEVSSALEVFWDCPVIIGADTVALCTAIAEQAAVALENARLYAETATRAECDALTGLLNHRAVLDASQKIMQHV